MSAKKNEQIGSGVEKDTFEYIKQNAPDDYAKIVADPEMEKCVISAIKEVCTEVLDVTRAFGSNDPTNAEKLHMHLSQSRIQSIKKAFDFKTFQMSITKQPDGKYVVLISRDDKPLHPERVLVSALDIDWAKIQQYASILVECIMLFSSVLGISFPTNKANIERAVEETAQLIQNSSKLQKAMQEFIESWNHAGGNVLAEAKAIFYLMKDSSVLSILWNVMKILFSEMSYFDMIKTCVTVIALIVAAVATDGIALYAKIVLALVDATTFVQKMMNIKELQNIKNSL